MKPTKQASAVNGTYYSQGRHIEYSASTYQRMQEQVRIDVDQYIKNGGHISVIESDVDTLKAYPIPCYEVRSNG